jgi:hypothetical protein
MCQKCDRNMKKLSTYFFPNTYLHTLTMHINPWPCNCIGPKTFHTAGIMDPSESTSPQGILICP